MIKQEFPFTSIEDDMAELGIEVKHEGMSRQAAVQLAGDIEKHGLEASIVPKRDTGRVRKSRGYVPHGNRNAIEDAHYLVRITQGHMTRDIENRRQWELYKLYHGVPTVAVLDDTKFERLLAERTGLTIKELPKATTATQVQESEEIETEEYRLSITDLDLFETALEDAWEAA